MTEADAEGLQHRVLRAAQRPLGAGDASHQPPFGAGHRMVGLGQHPLGGALEQMQPADARLDGRHELHGRGTAADDGDPCAGEVVVVTPARGVEDLAGEVGGCPRPAARRMGQ